MYRSLRCRLLPIATFAGAALLLAACGPSQPERQLSRDVNAAVTSQFITSGQTLSAPITGASGAPSFAVLALPRAAGHGKLTEKQFTNGWRQSMGLDNASVAGGWNDLSIEIMGEPADAPRPNTMRLYKPTGEAVRREIVSRIHGVPMRIVGRPMSNALGSYGLAVGAGPGGLRCAFAWQWVDNLVVAARGEKSTFFNSGDMPASIRMRLCRRGVTADQLAAWYEQLVVSDTANVMRVAEALRSNAAAAAAGGGTAASPFVDASDSLEATLTGAGAAPPAGARAAHPKRRHVAHASHRRRAAPDAANGFEPPTPLTTPSSPNADGRQYLAPRVTATNVPRYGAGPGVDPTLPARAYRGPSTARAITPPPGGAPVYLGPAPQ